MVKVMIDLDILYGLYDDAYGDNGNNENINKEFGNFVAGSTEPGKNYEEKKKEIVVQIKTMKEAIAAKKKNEEEEKYVTIYVEEGGFAWSVDTPFQMKITKQAFYALEHIGGINTDELIHNKENNTYDYPPIHLCKSCDEYMTEKSFEKGNMCCDEPMFDDDVDINVFTKKFITVCS